MSPRDPAAKMVIFKLHPFCAQVYNTFRSMFDPHGIQWSIGRYFPGVKSEDSPTVDAEKVGSSAVAVVITTKSESRSAWERAGQVVERLVSNRCFSRCTTLVPTYIHNYILFCRRTT